MMLSIVLNCVPYVAMYKTNGIKLNIPIINPDIVIKFPETFTFLGVFLSKLEIIA